MKLSTEHYFNGSTQTYAASETEAIFLPTGNVNSLWLFHDYTGLDLETLYPATPDVFVPSIAASTGDNGERQVYNLAPPTRIITKIKIWLYWEKTASSNQPTVDIKVGTVTETAKELVGDGVGARWEAVTFDGVWTPAQFATAFQVGITSPTLSGFGVFRIVSLYCEAIPSGYDHTKTNLGQWIRQHDNLNPEKSYVGPFQSHCHPTDISSLNITMPRAIDLGNGIHWVFLSDAASASPTRAIGLYTFDTVNITWSFKGYVTLTYPTATNHSIYGFEVVRHVYNTGTVAVSGTAVTGTGTDWHTKNYAVGARIGFGSDDPSEITTWHYITAITSDSSITIGNSATVSAGSKFVIEELRIYTATVNATATNGGLYATKGLNFDDFKIAGSIIPAATTVDNIKAVYWLADASTVTNTVATGLCLGTQSDESQYAYVSNGESALAAIRMYKYDVRKRLASLSSGKSVSALITKTNPETILLPRGTLANYNAIIMATAKHGPGANVPCIYGITQKSIFRIPETSIGQQSTDRAITMIKDYRMEITPGDGDSYYLNADGNGLASIQYDASIDRFLISGKSGKEYLTKYYEFDRPFDRAFGVYNNQIDRLHVHKGQYPVISQHFLGHDFFCLNGILYSVTPQTAGIHPLHAIPLNADWDFAEGTTAAYQNRVITPMLSTPYCNKFSSVSVNAQQLFGDNSVGMPAEPYRLYARSNGIEDDSGSWTLIGQNGDISGIAPNNEIQFMIEFRIVGPLLVPARIRSLLVTYEGHVNDEHFQPSAALSNFRNKSFVWRFATAFDRSVPPLKVKYVDAKTGGLLFTDTTSTNAYGAFTKSTNGSTWGAFNTTDKTNETTYIRYVPTAGIAPDNVLIHAYLTLEKEGLDADFNVSTLGGEVVIGEGYSVDFTDISWGDPIYWAWDFGDGYTSTEQNPTHIYWKGGVFDVTLTITNAAGDSVSITKSEYITITDATDAGPRWGWGGDPIADLVLNAEGEPSDVSGGFDTNKRIPNICRSPNGTLIVFFQSSTQVSNDFGVFGICCKRSLDNGVTWTKAENIYNYPDFLVSTINLGRAGLYLGLGAVAVDYIGMDGNPPSITLHVQNKVPNLRAGGLSDGFKALTFRSEDDGVTWTGPTDITADVDYSGVSYTFVAANVNTTSNVITLDGTPNPALYDGQGVAFSTTTTLPAPLDAAGPGGGSTTSQPYYLHMLTATTFTVHTTYAGGLDGSSNIVDITTQGTGTHQIDLWWGHLVYTSKGIQLGEDSSLPGLMIVTGDHRSGGVGGPSYFQTIASLDGGVTWSIFGRTVEKNANAYQNESAIIQTSNPNRLYVSSRNVNNTPRFQTVSNDAGFNWMDARAARLVGGANLTQTSTWGSLEKLGDTFFLSGPASLNYRKDFGLWYSHDEGMTWTFKPLFYRYGGYSELFAIDEEHLLVVFEGSYNSNLLNGGSNYTYTPYHALKIAVVSKNWLLSTDTPLYADYFFNELPSGYLVNPYGQEIIDYGYMDARASSLSVDQPLSYSSSGIALPANSAGAICLSPIVSSGNFEFLPASGESITYSIEATITTGSNGVLIGNLLNGRGVKLECSAGFLSGTVADGTTTITTTANTTTINDGVRRVYTMVRDATNGLLKLYVNGVLEGNGVIADTTGSTRHSFSGLGVYIGQNQAIPFNVNGVNNISSSTISLAADGQNIVHGWSDGQAVMFCSMGKAWSSYTGGLDTALTAGTVYFVRTTGLSSHQIRVFPTSADAIANTNVITLNADGHAVGTHCYVIPCAASAPYNLQGTIHSARITRAALSPNDFISSGRAPTTTRVHRNNYTPTIPAFDPTDIASLHSWYFATIYEGERFYGDHDFQATYPLPWPDEVTYKSCRDIKAGYFLAGTDSRPARYYVADTNVGPYINLGYSVSSGAATYQALHPIHNKNIYDFLMGDGPNGSCHSSVAFAVRWDSASAGGNQIVVDTTFDSSTSHPGYQLYKTSAGKLHVIMNNGTTSFANFDFSPTFSLNTWYFMMVVANGYSAAMDLYYTTLNGTYNKATPYTPSTCTKVSSSAIGTATSPTSYGRMSVGARLGNISGDADLSIKNMMFFNASLGQSDADNLAAFCVKG